MNFYRIKEIVNPKTVIDIGANVGEFSKNLYRVCPKSDITMIEANPKCEKYLEEIGLSYCIVALSDTNKEDIDFYINKENDVCTGCSLYLEDTSFYQNCDIEKVDTYTLDEVNLYTEGVDLIKLDVQGSEIDILRGSGKTLERTKSLLVECSLYEYNIGSPIMEDIVEFLIERGFYPVEILQEHWSRPGIDLVKLTDSNRSVVQQIDILFLRDHHVDDYNICSSKLKQYRELFDSNLV